jgi:hypothetical protein
MTENFCIWGIHKYLGTERSNVSNEIQPKQNYKKSLEPNGQKSKTQKLLKTERSNHTSRSFNKTSKRFLSITLKSGNKIIRYLKCWKKKT